MNNKIRILFLLALCSCARMTVEPSGTLQGSVSMEIAIDFTGMSGREGTKSIFDGLDIEGLCSGFTVGVYSDGHLYSEKQAEAEDGNSVSIELPSGQAACVYVLANMWVMDSRGRPVSLVSMPESERDLQAYEYRLDGSYAGGGQYYENFSDMRALGLPASGSAGISSGGLSGKLVIPVQFLMAKLILDVRHDGITGMAGQGRSDVFENSSLYLRQVNGRLAPFSSGGSFARSESDIINVSDYDAVMSDSDANRSTYVYYLPENVMGENRLVRSAHDKVPGNAPGGHEGLVSFVEYSGTVDGCGIGGDMVCRFCLGGNATTDFNVRRNTIYNVEMNFSTGSLFGEPEWKVDADIWDSRLFEVVKDMSYAPGVALTCEDGDFIAVRRSRPGRCYLYLNEEGQYAAVNSLFGKALTFNSDFQPCGLNDIGVKSNFDKLKDYGLKWDYDASLGMLEFSVSDFSRFSGHIGETVALEMLLEPGGKQKRIAVRLMEDQYVGSADGSLTDGFYVGMKRDLRLAGFASSEVGVFNAQQGDALSVECGSGPARASLPSSEEKALKYRLDSGQCSFPVFACHENDRSHRCTLTVMPEDTFNDDPMSVAINAVLPSLSFTCTDDEMYVSGDEITFSILYLDLDGKVIPYSSFDEETYRKALEPSFSYDGAPFDEENFEVGYGGTGAGGYPVGTMCIRSLPDSYRSSETYSVRMTARSGPDGVNAVFKFVAVPAFHAVGPSGILAVLHDYALVDPGLLAPECVAATGTVVRDPSFAYGVKSLADVGYEVVPQSRYSYANCCLGATAASEGVVAFDLSDPYRDDNAVTHSVGLHSVVAYAENKRSGQKIRSEYPFLVEVYCHTFVGAVAMLGDYDNTCGSVGAKLFAMAMENMRKVSLWEFIDSKSLNVKCDETLANVNYGSLYKEYRVEERTGVLRDYPEPNHDDGLYLTARFYAGGGDPSVAGRISSLYGDRSGRAFYGSAEFFGYTPKMSLLERRMDRDVFVDSLDISVGDLSDTSGRGYYRVDLLENLCPSTGGWMNEYYGWGMQYYHSK